MKPSSWLSSKFETQLIFSSFAQFDEISILKLSMFSTQKQNVRLFEFHLQISSFITQVLVLFPSPENWIFNITFTFLNRIKC